MVKTPTIKDMYELCREIKKDISDEYRAFEFDEEPGIQLTVGANESGEWNWQTGDNSYNGPAYFYRHWAVIGVYKNSNCMDLAKDIRMQLEEQMF